MENEISFYRFNDLEIVQGYSSHSFPRHSHRHYCLGLILDGVIEFSCERQHYRLAKGQLYLVPPFTEHTIAAIDDRRYGYLVFCFSGTWLENEITVSLRPFAGQGDTEGEHLLMCYHNFKQDGNAVEFLQRVGVVLSRLTTGASERLPKFSPVVVESVNYIEDHLEESLDLQHIAEAVHITKFHLSRQFKKQVGIAPYQYYTQAKIKKVKQGLLAKQSLSDLAFNLNFTDQSHLCNTFKKYTGVTPLRFKKCFRDQTSE